ncbi:glutamyl-tRNA reductase [Poseidonibacter ostreae]|jgi:glutamyl-tRNA reductase|uniref:Glutamyl-tRNA reductase n=1 Tax=Poseidonibacter ostreae TaxID=2654171 RepID=A0A6L4WW90_9BACT|nr:glutamyl-tRNA reductase [Poseidonibacter ostreae]KAB7885591.1 glutamyl-tRNA reductase [Poseidonibacter ostreae]KAB7891010.1 glutamyl-tRNA reductase [Poseidonibacter ostreae]KAB7892734.1 glutamyl-tRNA reductase [Poseidonibacter ostreae]
MSYLIISFSHKNTDIEMREKLAFGSDEDKDRFIRSILSNNVTKEAVLLSTCNRVEIITRSINIKSGAKLILEELAKYSGVDYALLYKRADIYDNDSAVHHIFSVASALDSLVIGETQIVGQLKDAFRFSQSKGHCSQKITRLMHFAFKCAATVRNATSLGTGSVSVASTAVAKAKDIIKDTCGVKALVIGAGEMSELTIKHLLSSGFDVILTSRDIKKAQNLANTFEQNVDVAPYENLTSLLGQIPVMITATSAPYPIITSDNTPDANFNRYWFDIAVPRDIDDIDKSGLNIYSVDDLQDIVNENMSLRAEQAKTAYSIVSKMSLEFYDWLKSLDIEPVVKTLYTKADDVIEKKVQHAIKKGFIKQEDEENIRKLCQTVITEYLHAPSKKLKSISKNMECDIVVGTIQNMFTSNSDEDSEQYKCEHLSKK